MYYQLRCNKCFMLSRLVWFARLDVRDSEVRWPLSGLPYSSFLAGVRLKIGAGLWYPTQYGERLRAPGGCVFNACPSCILAIPFGLAASGSSTAGTSTRNYAEPSRALADTLRGLSQRQRMAAH